MSVLNSSLTYFGEEYALHVYMGWYLYHPIATASTLPIQIVLKIAFTSYMNASKDNYRRMLKMKIRIFNTSS